jgi:hypothetical protein
LDRFQGPFFRRGEGRVDEGFTQIDLAAVPEVLGEALQQPIEAARALPELEATMASLVRRIARWQVVPRRARAQDPQDAVHDGPRIGPRPAAPIRATARAEGRFEHGPLDVGEVHAVEYDGDPTDVSGRHRIYEIASRVHVSADDEGQALTVIVGRPVRDCARNACGVDLCHRLKALLKAAASE